MISHFAWLILCVAGAWSAIMFFFVDDNPLYLLACVCAFGFTGVMGFLVCLSMDLFSIGKNIHQAVAGEPMEDIEKE